MLQTLSLLALSATAPWAQSAQQPTKPWIELPANEFIYDFVFSSDDAKLKKYIAISVLDNRRQTKAERGNANMDKRERRWYDLNTTPDGGAHLVDSCPVDIYAKDTPDDSECKPQSPVLKESPPTESFRPSVTQWLKEQNLPISQAQVSEDDSTALIVQPPSQLGETGHIRLIEVADGSLEPRSHGVEIPGFINASLRPSGKLVLVQSDGDNNQWLDYWTVEGFISGSAANRLIVTGDYQVAHTSTINTYTGQNYDYFFLKSPLALEFFSAKVNAPATAPIEASYSVNATVSVSDAIDVTRTSNYVTYVDLHPGQFASQPDSQTLVVAERDRVILKHLGTNNSLSTIGLYQHKVVSEASHEEIRSCAFVIDHRQGSPPRAALAVGLIRILDRPSLTKIGACQVAAKLFLIEHDGKIELEPAFETPWLDATSWNATSPELLYDADQELLLVSSRDKVWRFEVGS